MGRSLVAVWVLVCGACWAQGGAAQDPLKVTREEVRARLERLPATHPRLFINRADAFKSIASESGTPSVAGVIRDWIIREADAVLPQKPTVRKQEGFRMQGQSQVQKRVGLLATAYLFTGKAAYVERAKEEMLAAAAFSDWNPKHFLDTATMTLGLALGYDWLYDALDPDTRATVAGAIRDQGLKQALARKYFWTEGNNNWTQVCWSGMVAGALAIHDQEPELALSIIHKAVTSVPYSIRPYAPKGSYPEGPGYWSYGTTYYVIMLDLLTQALGTDFGLYDLPGFPQTGEYINLVTGPSGRFYNYADGGDGRSHLLALWWLARRSGRFDWLTREVADLREALRLNNPEKTGLRQIALPALLLLWAREIDEHQLTSRMPLHWSSGGHVPLVVLRTAWADPNAGYLATKGGPASQNHGHMDAGSFIYEADGVRWAVDLGAQRYYSIEKLGMSLWNSKQDSDRWKVFRLNSASHNLITIDGQPHVVGGSGSVAHFSDNPERPHAVLDLSPVYAGQAERVWRACALLPSRTGVIQDRLKGVRAGAAVRWAMVTQATGCQTVGQDMVLTHSGKSLTVRVVHPAEVRWRVIDLAEPPNPWDVANPGVRMIAFEVTAPQDGRVETRVVLLPGGTAPVEELPDLITLSGL